MAVDRPGEDHAGNRRDRCGLRRTASRFRWIARMAWHRPHFTSVLEPQGRQTATLRRVERTPAKGSWTGYASRQVGGRRVHLLAVAGHAPLHAAVGAALAHPRLPEDFALLVRVESVHDSGLLSGN